MRKKLKIKRPLGMTLEPQEIILDRMVQAKSGRGYYQGQKLERPIRQKGIKLWSFLSLLVSGQKPISRSIYRSRKRGDLRSPSSAIGSKCS